MKTLFTLMLLISSLHSFAVEEVEKVIVSKNSVESIDIGKECVQGGYSFEYKIKYSVDTIISGVLVKHKFTSDSSYDKSLGCDSIKDEASSKEMNEFLRDLEDVNADYIQVISKGETAKCYHNTMAFLVNKSSRRAENKLGSYTLVPCP